MGKNITATPLRAQVGPLPGQPVAQAAMVQIWRLPGTVLWLCAGDHGYLQRTCMKGCRRHPCQLARRGSPTPIQGLTAMDTSTLADPPELPMHSQTHSSPRPRPYTPKCLHSSQLRIQQSAHRLTQTDGWLGQRIAVLWDATAHERRPWGQGSVPEISGLGGKSHVAPLAPPRAPGSQPSSLHASTGRNRDGPMNTSASSPRSEQAHCCLHQGVHAVESHRQGQASQDPNCQEQSSTAHRAGQPQFPLQKSG